MSGRVERIVEKYVERGPDHRITKVREVHIALEPDAPEAEAPDEPIYLTEEDMRLSPSEMVADLEREDDDPESYPGPAEE